jgi:hypothetical protein
MPTKQEMMQKPKLDVLVVFFAFGGNGSVGMQLPQITTWFAKLHQWMKQDERIGRIACVTAGDIPLSMERNKMVKKAMDQGFDCILMLDSDNVPDLYVGHDDSAKPFFQTSFDFLYSRALRELPTVVCAPYCGPPPHPTRGGEENVYVFYAEANETPDPNAPHPGMRFKAYSREHAAIMQGIQPIAAGPTGVILYSVDAFKLMPTKPDVESVLNDVAAGKVGVARAKELLAMESWFYYEYEDGECTHKASTEDCTNTREIQLAGIQKHGEPIVFCNWDSWAGHYKPKCVGKPNPLRIEQVSSVFAEAVRSNISTQDSAVMLDLPDIVPDIVPDATPEVPITEPAIESASPRREPGSDFVMYGRKFRNPVLSKQECTDLYHAINVFFEDLARGERSFTGRVIVTGDRTGEVSWSVHHAFPNANVFCVTDEKLAVGPDGVVNPLGFPDGMPKRVKLTHIDPNEIDPQEVDLIIVCQKGRTSRAIRDVDRWGRRHLSKDGTLLVCGFTGLAALPEELPQVLTMLDVCGGSGCGTVVRIDRDDFDMKVDSDISPAHYQDDDFDDEAGDDNDDDLVGIDWDAEGEAEATYG